MHVHDGSTDLSIEVLSSNVRPTMRLKGHSQGGLKAETAASSSNHDIPMASGPILMSSFRVFESACLTYVYYTEVIIMI